MFALFMFMDYYPAGGINDFKGSFASKEAIYNYIRERNGNFERFDNYQITTPDLELVEEGECKDLGNWLTIKEIHQRDYPDVDWEC